MLEGSVRQLWESRFEYYTAAGVPPAITRLVADAGHFYAMIGEISPVDATGQPAQRVAQVFFALGSELQTTWFVNQINALPVDSHWQALATESYRDELERQLGAMTVSVLQAGNKDTPVEQLLSDWLNHNQLRVQRWQSLLLEFRSAGQNDYPMIAVAMRELADLAVKTRQVTSMEQHAGTDH